MKREIELRVSEVPANWRKQLGLEECGEDERICLTLKEISSMTRRQAIDMALAAPTTKNAGRPVHELVREGRDEREARFERLRDEARTTKKPEKSEAK